ncbi:MAG TPA: methyltransferase domain-containing protein [bacterium]|nr:methyltransferase domain-containing protein [bacterium]
MKKEYKPILSTFERMADAYSRSSGMEEVNRRSLAPIPKEWEGRILDVGAGAGAFIEKYVDPAKHEIYTVDFSMGMIRQTAARLGEMVGSCVFPTRALAQALPFPRDAFDAALCVNTLHNMPSREDIRLAVSEMARVIRPRGALLLEFRNSENPARKRISEMYDTPELPQKSFTFEEVSKMLGQIGLETVSRIPIWGDYVPSGPWEDAIERLKTPFRKMPPERAPRFAAIAIKPPGFRSSLLDAFNNDAAE